MTAQDQLTLEADRIDAEIEKAKDYLFNLQSLAITLTIEHNDQAFDAYEVHPVQIVGRSSDGKEILEQCAVDDPDIAYWTLYGHYEDKGLEALHDFDNRSDAESALVWINKTTGATP